MPNMLGGTVALRWATCRHPGVSKGKVGGGLTVQERPLHTVMPKTEVAKQQVARKGEMLGVSEFALCLTFHPVQGQARATQPTSRLGQTLGTQALRPQCAHGWKCAWIWRWRVHLRSRRRELAAVPWGPLLKEPAGAFDWMIF